MKTLKYNTNSLFPTVSREDLYSPVETIFNEFFNDFFTEGNLVKRVSRVQYPKFDIVEYDDRVEFEAELAGMNKDDLVIETRDKGEGIHELTIKGKRQDKYEKKDRKKVILKELKTSSFSRTFTLGSKLDPNIKETTFKNGMLKIVVNKKKQDKENVKRIEIK